MPAWRRWRCEPRYSPPMLHRLRFALMCLLLLALPLQGYAAATMLNCGPNHAAAASVDAHHAQHQATGDHGASPHDAGQGHHLADGVTKTKCSACASCCVGVALPASALVFAAASPAVAPVALFPIGPIGFTTSGPDRPPRTSLV